ncbi:MAG: response regulator transcription factor [Lachnospiraceae bacterium]|nr:response regulator transcription factor [Lachnospiraceae bacterium]
MSKLSILIIEDEKNICNFIKATLKPQGYKIITATSAAEGLSIINSGSCDVVLLDLGLPDMDGLEVIKQVRTWSSLPIIIISARTKEQEKVQALDLGADDYITKPFGTAELMARIRTALRHSNRLESDDELCKRPYTSGALTIDFDKRLVLLNGESVHLTQIEFKIISLLARNAGKVLTYDAILTHVWGPYIEQNNQILRVNMANVRRKLEKNPAEPEYLFTEVGIGYRMAEET